MSRASLKSKSELAVDGPLRRSFDTATGKAALHVVNAWANNARLMLAQCPVEGKSNEIKAVPTLLALLDVRGCIVTCDALNTQKGLARQIIEQGGDYVLALKENHALLCQEVRDYFAWCQNATGWLGQNVRWSGIAKRLGTRAPRSEKRFCGVSHRAGLATRP